MGFVVWAPQSKILAMPMTASEIPTEGTNHDRLFISGLETDSFVFLSSRFIRFTNMSNQIRRICVTAKQPSQQEQNFFSSMLFSFSARVCF